MQQWLDVGRRGTSGRAQRLAIFSLPPTTLTSSVEEFITLDLSQGRDTASIDPLARVVFKDVSLQKIDVCWTAAESRDRGEVETVHVGVLEAIGEVVGDGSYPATDVQDPETGRRRRKRNVDGLIVHDGGRCLAYVSRRVCSAASLGRT